MFKRLPIFYIVMKNFVLVIVALMSCNTFILSQTTYRAMFYNVENLFDTVDDPLKNDDEFLPGGAMRWNDWKYWEKLKNITRVVTAVGEMSSPSLVGLCEVENDSVLYDLTKRSPLRVQGYEFVVTDSPDERGIDVALLYQPHHFSLIKKNEYRISFTRKDARSSRNILHVEGRVINGDTLDVFVVHPPSRYGGQLESEPQRLDAARLLRCKVDSIFEIKSTPNILIMGDFNDYPHNKSLHSVLKARCIKSKISDKELYNLFFHRQKERNFGTYYFQGRWGILDQILVSGGMLSEKSSIYVKSGEAKVFKAEFLLEEDKNTGVKKPFRTYLGPRYVGGFSDHLPVYVDLIVR